jgi:hypothetical protein
MDCRNMKWMMLAFLLAATNLQAQPWGPSLIEFDLEGGLKTETMLWISGFSYSSTAFYQGCGALEKSKYVESRHLIIVLNGRYSGQTITSEQATETLSRYLKEIYVCETI